MPIQQANLLVLRCADLVDIHAFYERLGLVFIEEQHGNGPVHHAATLGSLVLELYPGQPGAAPDRMQRGATTLGFCVVGIDALVEAIRAYGRVIIEPTHTAWGCRAVVLDPDGRALDLTEPGADNVAFEVR